MKALIKLLIAYIISLFLGLFLETTPSKDFVQVIFAILGIMFTLGLGIIVSFDLKGIKNPKIIEQMRNNLNVLRKNFFTYFIFACLSVIYAVIFDGQKTINFNIYTLQFQLNILWTNFTILFYIIGYFAYIFYKIQELNNELFDKLLKLDK